MEPQNTQNTQMDIGKDGINRPSKRTIGCALTVLHALGTGFLENVYENALVHELRKSGLASRNTIPWSFDTMGSWSGNMRLTCSTNTSYRRSGTPSPRPRDSTSEISATTISTVVWTPCAVINGRASGHARRVTASR
jgi:hypothetical protein